MADLTPKERRLPLEQFRQPESGAKASAGPAGAEGHASPEVLVASSPSAACGDVGGPSVARRPLVPSGRPLHETPLRVSLAPPTAAVGAPDASSPKLQRLQLIQRTLLEHQQQLLRQREHLQRQQLLLFQRSQERSIAPHSLAQLFAELHESRQQQSHQAGLRHKQPVQEQQPWGATAGANYRITSGRTLDAEEDGPLQGRQPCPHGGPEGSFSLQMDGKSWEQEGDHEPSSLPRQRVVVQVPHLNGRAQEGRNPQCWAARRQILRAAALLDLDTLLSGTLRSLGRDSGDAVPPGPGTESRSSSSKEGRSGSCTLKDGASPFSFAERDSPSPPGLSLPGPGGHQEATNGKVIHVHGEPLPPATLCAGIFGRARLRHCLRVTLTARRCAVKTRRSWRALVPLFPRRSAYSPAALLSDEELRTYTHIGPRTSTLGSPSASLLESWEPPKEPYTAPGLYILHTDGQIVAAWAVALDSEGCLRRCTATIASVTGDLPRDGIYSIRKRPKQEGRHLPQGTSDELLGVVNRESGSVTVTASQLKTLETWYTEVAKEPLTAQQMRSLTLAEYAAGFGKYAEGLVTGLSRLIETRHPQPYPTKMADTCGCSCSICIGQPCRVRLAWRPQLMAFELAIDKTAAERPHSDSSGEESGGGGMEVPARIRPAAAARAPKGRWEWCRLCPLGCRMQLCLLLHEIYQPLTLTRSGLRSALAQLLLRLRRYVTLSPLAIEFLMQRVQEIRLSSFPGCGKVEVTDALAKAKSCDCSQSRPRYNWAIRDWAEACWQRRQRSQQTNASNGVIASDNLDSSVARLSMLSAALRPPAASPMEPGGGEAALSVMDAESFSALPLLPEAKNPAFIAEAAAEQIRLLVGGMAQGQDMKSVGDPEAHALRAAAISAVAMSRQEGEEGGGSKSPHFSYPVSIASSQVPSACSTPPRQCSRPRMGRCFALPRSVSAVHPPRAVGAPDEAGSTSVQECQLHVHCDGMSTARRGRGFERDDWGRGGYVADGYGGDGIDASPRRLRRMQRARFATDDPQPPPPRRVEVRRRVTPLVPWWWDEYIRTGEAKKTKKTSGSGGAGTTDCFSDGSSSVSSTVSLAAAPHLFRIPCCNSLKAMPSSAETVSWQDFDSAAAMILARLNEPVDREPPTGSTDRVPRMSPSRDGRQGDSGNATAAYSGEFAVELIHAAAQLVDSLDTWPSELGPKGAMDFGVEPQMRSLFASGGPKDDHVAEPSLGASQGATSEPPTGLPGRRGRQPKSNGGTSVEALDAPTSQGLLTFVSTVLAAPSEGEVDSLKGFEMLQGALRVLFSSAETLPEEPQQCISVNDGWEHMQQELPHRRHTADLSAMVEPPADLGSTRRVDRPIAMDSRRAAAQRGSGTAPLLDIYATTPLLRSLAASAAPPVESAQGRLAVDDFYAHPLLKRAVSYRDAYEPFDKDCTDVQIRLKPLRAFGLRQQRHSRHRRRSWRQSPQSSGSSPRYNSPAPTRAQGGTGLPQRKPPPSTTRDRVSGLGLLGERTGTVRIGGKRVVVRTVEGTAGWASREPGGGDLSDFSVSRCSMSVDSSLSSRGVSVCSRATSNATGSASDASLQGGGTPHSPSVHEGTARHRRGRSRPPPGGRTPGGGGNTSTPTGVYLDVARKLWRCQWRENGRFKTKSFPLNQYKTLKEARRACVIFRCLMGGWEVQPAWLGDDDGGDGDPAEQSENQPAPVSSLSETKANEAEA